MCSTDRSYDRSPTGIVSRRSFLTVTLGAATAFVLPATALATVSSDFPNARFLWIQSAMTGEVMIAPFTLDGHTLYYAGYFRLCRIMRDVHVSPLVGDVEIDVRLLEGLYEIQQVHELVGIRRPIMLHSAFRTKATNHEVGGAPDSLHERGMAADFHIDGVPLSYTLQICRSRSMIGGIGDYPNDGHIHIDCGPHRYWEEG